VFFLTAFSTGKPKEILGTNTPSITSKCIQSAAEACNILISLSRFPMSADRTDGAIRGVFMVKISPKLKQKKRE
jgi:hypothetical protein